MHFMKTPAFLYPLCVFSFALGGIMLVTQLVTGLTVATQVQCSGVEYLSGQPRVDQAALIKFCGENGYYTGK